VIARDRLRARLIRCQAQLHQLLDAGLLGHVLGPGRLVAEVAWAKQAFMMFIATLHPKP